MPQHRISEIDDRIDKQVNRRIIVFNTLKRINDYIQYQS